jgi:hypothetical protein
VREAFPGETSWPRAALKIGNGLEPGIETGPARHPAKQFETVLSYIGIGNQEAKRLAVRGRALYRGPRTARLGIVEPAVSHRDGVAPRPHRAGGDLRTGDWR